MNKKLIIIISIAIIILGFIIYKNFIEVPGHVAGQRAIEELMSQLYHEEADKHLEKVFVKTGLDNPLPEFENINEAPKDWIWRVLYNNLNSEENLYTYNQIQEKLTEVFSEKLTIKFPEEGIENLIEKDSNGNYIKLGINDTINYYNYSIKTSIQEDNTYRVDFVEYLIVNDLENRKYIFKDSKENTIKEYNYKEKELSLSQVDKLIKEEIITNEYDLTRKELKMEIKDINNIEIISVKITN